MPVHFAHGPSLLLAVSMSGIKGAVANPDPSLSIIDADEVQAAVRAPLTLLQGQRVAERCE